MNGEKCIKPECGCITQMSSTIYWCDKCNIPVCGTEGKYISTDLRPVFPEENALISVILENSPDRYQAASVWYGNGTYIIDGKKVKLSVTKINKMPIEDIRQIKKKYELFAEKIDYTFFNKFAERFIQANVDRYNYITEEAVHFVQQYTDKYTVEDMMVSFSGGKDSTVTSHIVNRALGTNKVLHVFGDTTL